MSEPQPRRVAVGAWVVFDVANTIFWTGVVGVTFPLWLTKDLLGDDATLGYTLAATMAVVLVAAPFLGAVSDQAGRRMPLLVATTLVSVSATLLLGISTGLMISLVLFALALSTMELGTIFYNAMLPEVSTHASRGKVSGMGQGIGYIGSFIAIGVALLFTGRYILVFRIVAILFFLFALPIFFLLKERPRQVVPSTALGKISSAFAQLSGNLRRLDQFPGLRRFLTARFFYSMGINTAVAFAVLYAAQTIGLNDREIYLILLAGSSVAIPSAAFFWGPAVDRIGPRSVLTTALLIWVGLLLFAVAIPWLSWTKHLYWAVGCLTGVALSGVWTADRPFMLSFTPPQYLGEFFGLHGMVGKLGRVVGPFMWAFLASTLELGQPAAVIGLVGCLAISYVMLIKMKIPVRSPSEGLIEKTS